jgi:hypothetical protein
MLTSCTAELEIRGNADRVIGETVKVSLIQGELGITEEIQLRDADSTDFDKTKLKASLVDQENLTLVIPADSAAGDATLRVTTGGDPPQFEVPLSINRMLFTLLGGVVEMHGLSPSTISSKIYTNATAVTAISLAPDGGHLALLTSTALQIFPLSADPFDQQPLGSQLANGSCLAALPSGAIACTSTGVTIITITAGETAFKQFPIGKAIGVSVSKDGSRAVILHQECGLDGDNKVISADCVTEVVIGENISLGAQNIEIDKTASASVISINWEGTGAVIGDNEKVYGLMFDTLPVHLNSWSWKSDGASVTPVAIARGRDKDGIPFFALAESTENRVWVGAISANLPSSSVVELRHTGAWTLAQKPTAISFGRYTDLYISTAAGFYSLDVRGSTSTPATLLTDLPLPKTTINTIAVQP